MVSLSPRPLVAKDIPKSPLTADLDSSKSATTATSPRSSPGATKPTAGIGKLTISKNYVIPPRPKPGRKPSSEVPPSRRKAQNREAQRAFRERKSQAVRVLEEQLAKQARDFELQQQQMRDQISALQQQQQLQQQLQQQQQQTQTQLSQLQQQQTSADNATSGTGFKADYAITFSRNNSMTGMSYPQAMSPQGMSPQSSEYLSGTYMNVPGMSPGVAYTPSQYLASSPQPPAEPLTPGASDTTPNSTMHSANSPSAFGAPATPADVVGLELLDHVLDQKLPVTKKEPSPAPRRLSRSRRSPETPPSPGVTRTDPPAADPLDLINSSWTQPAVPLRRSSALEVDFTAAFSARSSARPLSRPLPRPTSLLTQRKDRCGFCTDSNCICAESEAREQNADLATDLTTLGSPLTPPLNIGGSPLRHSEEMRQSLETGCTGDPSNCTQCRQDPMLTLFCSAVASKPPVAKLAGTFIPAQAAYKTLSRHSAFVKADLGEVVDALVVKSAQVEVNSVAKVLRMLDQQA